MVVVLVSVDLVAQVQHTVHLPNHPKDPVPELDPLYVGVAVAAHAVKFTRGRGGGGVKKMFRRGDKKELKFITYAIVIK